MSLPGSGSSGRCPRAGRARARGRGRCPRRQRPGLKRFLWPKGNPVRPGSSGTRVTTRAGAFATGPGLIPASWVPLVALGVLVALAVQAILAGREHLSTGAPLGISLAASVAGAAGARAWYV